MIYLIFSIIMLAPLYLLWVTVQAHEARLKTLESRKTEPSGKTGQLPITGATLYPPVENFNPEKPETLRPKMVRGREVNENVFEFDSKL